ncbi:hypothetical protein EVAR_15064_1 [Eumeta japonica]|uniref:Uncharacterized protein n=1 Tax=Eumeta variegata TaxID=151549 RepID=A0A4C1YN84_EUMVA|nr:hypothetical protein EVAR_15064_1 [Eumeta japonica]
MVMGQWLKASNSAQKVITVVPYLGEHIKPSFHIKMMKTLDSTKPILNNKSHSVITFTPTVEVRRLVAASPHLGPQRFQPPRGETSAANNIRRTPRTEELALSSYSETTELGVHVAIGRGTVQSMRANRKPVATTIYGYSQLQRSNLSSKRISEEGERVVSSKWGVGGGESYRESAKQELSLAGPNATAKKLAFLLNYHSKAIQEPLVVQVTTLALTRSYDIGYYNTLTAAERAEGPRRSSRAAPAHVLSADCTNYGSTSLIALQRSR